MRIDILIRIAGVKRAEQRNLGERHGRRYRMENLMGDSTGFSTPGAFFA